MTNEGIETHYIPSCRIWKSCDATFFLLNSSMTLMLKYIKDISEAIFEFKAEKVLIIFPQVSV